MLLLVKLWLSFCCFNEFWRKWVINGELWFLMIWCELLILLSWVEVVELLFLVISFACQRFWEETWVFIWKACLSDFGKQVVISDLNNLFWDQRNLNFSVEWDSTECMERIGENDIENGSTVWILCVERWMRKIGKSVLSDELW